LKFIHFFYFEEKLLTFFIINSNYIKYFNKKMNYNDIFDDMKRNTERIFRSKYINKNIIDLKEQMKNGYQLDGWFSEQILFWKSRNDFDLWIVEKFSSFTLNKNKNLNNKSLSFDTNIININESNINSTEIYHKSNNLNEWFMDLYKDFKKHNFKIVPDEFQWIHKLNNLNELFVDLEIIYEKCWIKYGILYIHKIILESPTIPYSFKVYSNWNDYDNNNKFIQWNQSDIIRFPIKHKILDIEPLIKVDIEYKENNCQFEIKLMEGNHLLLLPSSSIGILPFGNCFIMDEIKIAPLDGIQYCLTQMESGFLTIFSLCKIETLLEITKFFNLENEKIPNSFTSYNKFQPNTKESLTKRIIDHLLNTNQERNENLIYAFIKLNIFFYQSKTLFQNTLLESDSIELYNITKIDEYLQRIFKRYLFSNEQNNEKIGKRKDLSLENNLQDSMEINESEFQNSKKEKLN
jgi:hypothetical protein